MTTHRYSYKQSDWAPPGGASSNQMREIREPIEAAFLAGLRERVAQLGDAAWIKTHNGDSSVYIGWTFDKEGGYFVSFGLAHNPRLPVAEQRWFIWMQYRDEQGAADRIGETWFEAPYARDTELHLDVLMAWFAAHRRDVLAQGRNEKVPGGSS